MEIAIIFIAVVVVFLVSALISNSEKPKRKINTYSEKPKQKIDNPAIVDNNSTWDDVWGKVSDRSQADKEADDTLLSKIEQLKKLNLTFETTDEPDTLLNLKDEMEHLVQDCIMHEKLYSASFAKLKDAENILLQIKERYNELLYLVLKKSVEKYKLKISEQMLDESDIDFETGNIFSKIQYYQDCLEKTSINYNDCLTSFSEFHNQIEDLYSGLIYNDLDLPKAFSIILEKESFKNHIVDVIQLICNNKLNKENLDSLLNEYYTDVNSIKLDFIDLTISYIKFVINSYIITEKEMHNIEILKLYFRIKEGDFYKYRYNEIKFICEKQFSRLYQDNYIDYSDELFTVKMQKMFDLSYSQMEEFKIEEIKRALKEGANIMNLNTDKLINIK